MCATHNASWIHTVYLRRNSSSWRIVQVAPDSRKCKFKNIFQMYHHSSNTFFLISSTVEFVFILARDKRFLLRYRYSHLLCFPITCVLLSKVNGNIPWCDFNHSFFGQIINRTTTNWSFDEDWQVKIIKIVFVWGVIAPDSWLEKYSGGIAQRQCTRCKQVRD